MLKSGQKQEDPKTIKFYNRQDKSEPQELRRILKNVIHNFSSYTQCNDELVALSYGMDNQVPIRNNRNNITTEFKYFYQNLANDISHMPDVQLRQVKAKLRDACEKYCRIKIPCKTLKIYKKEMILF